MRDVDSGWPAVGARIHHSVGPWPLNVRDVTRVVAVKPGRMLELDARVWPTGTARISLTLTPEGDSQNHVTMGEVFDRGPAGRMPAGVQAALMRPRNIESLPLVGHRVRGNWVDIIHIDGFSRDCFAWRQWTSLLIVPGMDWWNVRWMAVRSMCSMRC
jgi:hypothetical protein